MSPSATVLHPTLSLSATTDADVDLLVALLGPKLSSSTGRVAAQGLEMSAIGLISGLGFTA